MKSDRIILIDELRGIAIIGMVIYHFLYTLSNLFSVNLGENILRMMHLIQPPLAGTFILIAGFTCRYSQANVKRGFRTMLCGGLITLFTTILVPSQAIYFGILHFLGISMLLYEWIHKWVDRANQYLLMSMLAVVFFATFNLQKGVLSVPIWGSIPLPYALYRFVWLAPIGLPPRSFTSADYFPLLPWFSLFLFGTLIGAQVREKGAPAIFYKRRSRILAGIGGKSLVIYLLHQPFIYIFLWSISLFAQLG
ncbi:heparan-alpha-glucosaminide N-acetyltransferase [Hydrogenoanaerobacterium sp.]|uniref:heparan-alpha-glucosaminide N-acetyltransferase n=1 Tax=Hydrogenoanaerobacterium sp. TaxID=2953763 RepID=UPI00289CC932|nr:heparan-alpha-glucosaminide N-acetyltransferase [Hydrogenoanaerobacterium sp.]